MCLMKLIYMYIHWFFILLFHNKNIICNVQKMLGKISIVGYDTVF